MITLFSWHIYCIIAPGMPVDQLRWVSYPILMTPIHEGIKSMYKNNVRGEVFLHSCMGWNCKREFLSKHMKLEVATALCAQCIEKEYYENKRSLELRDELMKHLHPDRTTGRRPVPKPSNSSNKP
jgi:hypothetical protein